MNVTLGASSSTDSSTGRPYTLVTFPSAHGLAVNDQVVLRNLTASIGPTSNNYYSVRSVVDNTHVVLSTDWTASSTSSGSGQAELAPAVATNVLLDVCIGSVSDPHQAWVPEPSVGAGAAAAPQWVNYYEFGRCLDVTGQNVNATYLIDYPCKQNPQPGAVAWNQKFTGPAIPAGAAKASGNFYTTSGSTNYCLTSPLTQNGLVVVKPCSATTAGQTWTVTNDDNSLSYTMKYTITDSAGLCLSLTSSVAAAAPWSAVDVERCVGRRDQKWNADPTTPGVVDVQEK
jgi:hypothetical protein